MAVQEGQAVVLPVLLDNAAIRLTTLEVLAVLVERNQLAAPREVDTPEKMELREYHLLVALVVTVAEQGPPEEQMAVVKGEEPFMSAVAAAAAATMAVVAASVDTVVKTVVAVAVAVDRLIPLGQRPAAQQDLGRQRAIRPMGILLLALVQAAPAQLQMGRARQLATLGA